MTNRYDTLDVSLNLSNSAFSVPKRFANTIDFDTNNIPQSTVIGGQNEDRVNKFRELYYKNEKLRKELKLLNVKLNEKLQKVKLMPSKRKKAQSVDLNVTKPTKALQRQLQNAYKQVAMYKKQIATLKVKQQSQSTYEKYKNLENEISYKDIEIGQVEAELKSIKSIKKLQDKTLIQDVENEDLKDKLHQYQRQFKQGQQKLKDIARKARKRQQQYKKQQAYQVALQKKLRKGATQQPQQDQLIMQKNQPILQKQVNEQDFKQVKEQILKIKSQNQAVQKKLDHQKKVIRDLKKKRQQYDQKFKGKDSQLKAISLKLESYRRLIKDNEKKMQNAQIKNHQEQTKYHDTKFNNLASENQSYKNIDIINIDSQDDDLDSQQNLSLNKVKNQPFQMSQIASTIKDQRQWKGKPRKITFGFMNSNDSIHKISGNLKGIKVWIDQTQLISGLGYIYRQNNIEQQSGVIGNRTNNQIRWQLQANDRISKIQGSFTEQGYLAQLAISTWNGLSAKLGLQAAVDKFNLKLEKYQQITGFYCGVRKLGNDTRITEIGFWITKNL